MDIQRYLCSTVLTAIDPGPIDVGLGETPLRVFDVECWPNFACVAVWSSGEGWRMFSSEPGVGEPFDALRAWVRSPAAWFAWNSKSYDNHIVAAIIGGENDPRALKRLSDSVIGKAANSSRRRPLPHFSDIGIGVDLFALLKGIFGSAGSLKWVAIKLHYPFLRAAPFDFDAELDRAQMVSVLYGYNVHDVAVTGWALRALAEAVRIRVWLWQEFGVDVLDTADSGLAEAVLADTLFRASSKRDLPRHAWPSVMQWSISGAQIVDRFEFEAPELQQAQATIRGWELHYKEEHSVKPDGSGERKISHPRKKTEFSYAGLDLRIGLGGAHTLDAPMQFEADADWAVVDFDFAAFYPSIIDAFQLRPRHLPARFNAAYRAMIDRRAQAVAAGDELAAAALKVSNNSVFGKTKSAYSWLVDPTMTAQVCLIGEMIILQTMETVSRLSNDGDGARVIMANTDGLTVRCRRYLLDAVRAKIAAVAAAYGLSARETLYQRLTRRDGNNYLAIDLAGKVRAKGAFGYRANDPTRFAAERIVVDAVQAFFLRDVPLAETIAACSDVRAFLNGFYASAGWTLTDQMLGGADLGRAARWIHVTPGAPDRLDCLYKRKGEDRAQRCTGTNGGSALGVRLLGDLPLDYQAPSDLDRATYVAKAERLIKSVTEPEARRDSMLAMKDLSQAQMNRFQANAACSEPDLPKCRALDLEPFVEAYAAKARGNSYDTMKAVLFRLWVTWPGALTRGDLVWCAEHINNAVDNYFAGHRQAKLDDMVDYLAHDVPPWPKPRSVADCLAQAWATTQRMLTNGEIEIATKSRKMYHNDLDRTTFLRKTSLTKYDRTHQLYPLALALCCTCARYKVAYDETFLTNILMEVINYYRE